MLGQQEINGKLQPILKPSLKINNTRTEIHRWLSKSGNHFIAGLANVGMMLAHTRPKF
jgi:hypothetical protein